jgi:hypothetical protein
MKLEVLYIDGCPHHEEAVRRVREVLADLGEVATLVHIPVRDDDDAARLRFLGSPSIRVDGYDVVPGDEAGPGRAAGPYAQRCRVYQTRTGLAGVPDKQTIRNAIQERPR